MKKMFSMFFALILMLCCFPAMTVFADMGDPDLSSDNFECYRSGCDDFEKTANSFYASIGGLYYYYGDEDPDYYDFEDQGWDPEKWEVYCSYTGQEIKPPLTLYWIKENGTEYTLTEGQNYTVSYENNVKPGKATITITGKGEVSGSKKITFYIKGTDPTIKSVSNTTSGVKVTWKKCAYVDSYNIYLVTDEEEVEASETYHYVGKTTKTSYTIPYKNSILSTIDDLYVCVKADYAGGDVSDVSDMRPYLYMNRPAVKKVTSPSKGKLKLTWAKVKTYCNGYQIEVSRSSSFAKYTIYKVKGIKTVSKTIKGLKSKKKYYVRIRCYGTPDYGKNPKVCYSAWSTVKSVTVK